MVKNNENEIKLTNAEKKNLEKRIEKVEKITLNLGNLRWGKLNIDAQYNAQEEQVLKAIQEGRVELSDILNKLKFKHGHEETDQFIYKDGKLIREPPKTVKPEPKAAPKKK